MIRHFAKRKLMNYCKLINSKCACWGKPFPGLYMDKCIDKLLFKTCKSVLEVELTSVQTDCFEYKATAS